MKIVYMGTPAFAVPPLRRLLDSGDHQVTAVVTQPDRPSGRGLKVEYSAVKELALERNLTVLQPEKIKGMAYDKVLASFSPDVIVVVAYGRILPKEILALPRFGCLNLHASILPKYRGAAPIQWAVAKGETGTGVTLMRMDEGLDTGDIVDLEKVEIFGDDDTRSVGNMLSVIGGEMLVRNLAKIEAAGAVESTPQDDASATLAPILKKADGLIDWTRPAEEIVWLTRGMQPWPTAFSFLHGGAWKFLAVEPLAAEDGGTLPADTRGDGKDPGKVTAFVKGRGFCVRTGDGDLLVTRVQPAGKRAMDAVDALNGKLVRPGDEFLSDPAFLAGTAEVE